MRGLRFGNTSKDKLLDGKTTDPLIWISTCLTTQTKCDRRMARAPSSSETWRGRKRTEAARWASSRATVFDCRERCSFIHIHVRREVPAHFIGKFRPISPAINGLFSSSASNRRDCKQELLCSKQLVKTFTLNKSPRQLQWLRSQGRRTSLWGSACWTRLGAIPEISWIREPGIKHIDSDSDRISAKKIWESDREFGPGSRFDTMDVNLVSHGFHSKS